MYIRRIKFISAIVFIVLFIVKSDLIEAANTICAPKCQPQFSKFSEFNNPKAKRTKQLKYRSPKGMQRRFMWNDMDDFIDGAMTGARAMKQMISDVFSDFTPEVLNYKNPIDFLLPTDASNRIRFIIKHPVNRFKKKQKAPTKNQPKPVQQSTSSVTHKREPVSLKEHIQPEILPEFMPSEELRKLEQEEERRVEATLSAMVAFDSSDDIVSGQINEFDESWTPLESSDLKDITSTIKPYPVSNLHTDTKEFSQSNHPNSILSYEVTENIPEESIYRPQSIKPQVKKKTSYNPFKVITTTTTSSTTETPNYPSYFIKNLKNLDVSETETIGTPKLLNYYESKRGPSFHYNDDRKIFPTYTPFPNNPPTTETLRSHRVANSYSRNQPAVTTQRTFTQSLIPYVSKTIKQEQIHIEKKQRTPHYSRLEEKPKKSSSPNKNSRGAIKFGDRLEVN